MNSEIAISLKNIYKTFRIRTSGENTIRERISSLLRLKKQNVQNIVALQNINIEIVKGESFGIIGRNGSGKSTLLNIMMESISPDKGGIVNTHGRIMRLALGLGIDPNLSARDNIYVNGSIIGLSFKQIGDIFENIIDFSELHDFIDTPVKFYSKGMKQRLMFSIAMYADADIFLLDEFFGGTGDKDFRIKSDNAFNERIINGKTNIIVSHSMQVIKKHCKRVLWLDKGKIIELGNVNRVTKLYIEDVTKRLEAK